jgi:hypothetical protein
VGHGTKPCWKESGDPTTGKRLCNDPSAGIAGTRLLRPEAGTARSRNRPEGQRAGLDLPTDGWQAPLRIQVRSEIRRCWKSRLSEVVRSSPTRLVVENDRLLSRFRLQR